MRFPYFRERLRLLQLQAQVIKQYEAAAHFLRGSWTRQHSSAPCLQLPHGAVSSLDFLPYRLCELRSDVFVQSQQEFVLAGEVLIERPYAQVRTISQRLQCETRLAGFLDELKRSRHKLRAASNGERPSVAEPTLDGPLLPCTTDFTAVGRVVRFHW